MFWQPFSAIDIASDTIPLSSVVTSDRIILVGAIAQSSIAFTVLVCAVIVIAVIMVRSGGGDRSGRQGCIDVPIVALYSKYVIHQSFLSYWALNII